MLELFRKFRFWLRRDRLSDEMDEEMKLHVELRARANRVRGIDDGDAAAAARRQFGNSLALREQGRDAWGFGWLERAIQDVRYACRRLLKQRMVTIVAVLTLGLGIGANTAMFTLVDALLFRPAPAANPHELVWISTQDPRSSRLQDVSYPDYRMYRAHDDLFQGVVAFTRTRASLGGASPRRVDAILVSGNYFQVLGIQPQSGRLFTDRDDDEPGGSPAVVLTDNLWRSQFGADPGMLNRSVPINGKPFTVVGIAPPHFDGLNMVDDEPIGLFLPLSMARQLLPDRPEALTNPADNWLEVVGRLRSDVSMARASVAIAGLSTTAPSQQVTDPARALILVDGQPQSLRAVLNPVVGGIGPGERGEIAPVLLLLLVVPALVLLVAAANVGNLLLSSGLARRTELSLRRALGATRGRIVRQLLAESVVLAIVAAVVATGMSVGLIRVIGALGRVPAIIIEALRPDARVFAATMVVGLASMLIFGLFPALSATSQSLLPSLKGEGTTGAGHRRKLRSAFVIAQVAVSLTLLITAALFVQSLSKALRVDPGFDVRHKMTASYDLALQGYSADRREAFNRELLANVRAMPGVESAAIASTLPLSGVMWGSAVRTEQMPETDGRRTYFAAVSDGYFQTLGLPLVLGRAISDADRAASAKVVVINETLSHQLWPDGNPIGQRLKLAETEEPWREVVGVTRNLKYDQLTEDPRAFLYLPTTQWARPLPVALLISSPGAPSDVFASLARTVRALDPDLPLFRMSTLEENVRHTLDLQLAASALLGVFGVLALLLAALGIYGVAAHGVALRTREIGIRMSLGARASQVLRMVIAEGVRLTAVGVVAGVGLSLAVSQLLASFLFGLRATDTMTFAAGGVVLCLVATLACYLPARRAARVDPLRALRHE